VSSQRFLPVLPILLGALLAGCHGDTPTDPTLPKATPVEVTAAAALTGWRQVSPGQAHTCGLDADSLAWCWGWNELGQLGIGTTSVSEPHPVPVDGGRRWHDIQSGAAHTCAINKGGRAFCWGTTLTVS
jgi:alpha-tubulin suppressor-like RCC1 family protein